MVPDVFVSGLQLCVLRGVAKGQVIGQGFGFGNCSRSGISNLEILDFEPPPFYRRLFSSSQATLSSAFTFA
ncbi:hypothetical protein, partial [uncultured Pelagimonas sp.]|uniref:hypothetical protein n=1 Tax=uncultured Pelagimonas sp. TaxID=1618102 RepID=UPI002637C06C